MGGLDRGAEVRWGDGGGGVLLRQTVVKLVFVNNMNIFFSVTTAGQREQDVCGVNQCLAFLQA